MQGEEGQGKFLSSIYARSGQHVCFKWRLTDTMLLRVYSAMRLLRLAIDA